MTMNLNTLKYEKKTPKNKKTKKTKGIMEYINSDR